MPVPSSIDARLYYRCALQRRDDARVLRKAGGTAGGAVYLAGYGVECILKALLLTNVPERQRSIVLQSFRGGKAHDYEWLRTQLRLNGVASFPSEINRSFLLVGDWTPELRYSPRAVEEDDADAFLTATEQIIHWADGRLY